MENKPTLYRDLTSISNILRIVTKPERIPDIESVEVSGDGKKITITIKDETDE